MLYVITTKKAAIHLYQKCGFEICGELANAVIIDGKSYNKYLMQRTIGNKIS